MRTVRIASLVLLSIVFAAVSVCAEITDTPHDLSSARTDGQLCVFCHIPHNNTSEQSLLWARNVESLTYTLYSSNTLDDEDFTTTSNLTGTESLLCLTCHDGTTAIATTGNGVTSGITAVSGNYNLGGTGGTELGNDHPINITMIPEGQAEPVDPGLKSDYDPCKLYGGKVQCSSCHNVHGETAATDTDPEYLQPKNDDPGTYTANYAKFLRDTPEGSGICLDCHDK